jgi:hypothetical protein
MTDTPKDGKDTRQKVSEDTAQSACNEGLCDSIPQAIWEGKIKAGSIELRCYVLDDGQRIIDSEDFEKLFISIQDGTFTLTDSEATTLAKFIKGKNT